METQFDENWFRVGAYESLAGLLVSHSPDGVGIDGLALKQCLLSLAFTV
ncbi:hypothetical protein OLMES_1474 [Oleiphilus messinensis]|uniref:Uncharacterized protein n=1 Tax=Oleiphilus messinensis TaxID=141451 RepID=A0A1Y0I559_9GAMM|nr:hypothetical protein OLMES_1474 [Oleiphilus messinensis]